MHVALALMCLSVQDFTLDQYTYYYDKKVGSSKELPIQSGGQLTEPNFFMQVHVNFEGSFTAEFELKHHSVPFDGKNLVRGGAGRAPHTAVGSVSLKRPGAYRWRARLTAGKEVTPWKEYPGDPAFTIPGTVAPLVFRARREATKEDLQKTIPTIETRLKELKIAGLQVHAADPGQDGVPKLEVAPNDPEYDLEPIRKDVVELVSHKGSLSWGVTRTLTLAESEKFGLLRDTPADCIYAQHHQDGHWNTFASSSLEKPALINLKTGISPQDITFLKSEKGLNWKVTKGAIEKAKKLPADASLSAVFDGAILTEVGVGNFLQAANAKSEMYWPYSAGSRIQDIFLTTMKYPLPYAFVLEEERTQREVTAEEAIKTLEKRGPDEYYLINLMRILSDTDAFARNKEAIESARQSYLKK